MTAHGVPSARSQHLVFLAHVWACAPFMVPWTRDPAVHAKLGDPTIAVLKPFVLLVLVYLIARTWLAWKDPSWLRWHYVFPPFDVLLVSSLIAVSHRGPLSTLTLLYLFPIVQASGSLNVRWAAFVGLLVVVGSIVSTLNPPTFAQDYPDPAMMGMRQLAKEDPLNVAFRVYFMIVVASLMTYQARIAAEYRSEARLAEDRNRLALDVHDGVQGSLIAVSAGLELMSRLADHDPEKAKRIAEDVRASARDAADELRFLVQRLRLPSLVGGFLPAMRQYAHAFAGRYGLEIEFEVRGSPRTLPPDTEQAVFRMLQEALNNVAKHAAASCVEVELSFIERRLEFLVRDDGKGIDGSPEGTGRAGMRERARAVGGEVALTNDPRGGARVSGWVPL